MNRLTKKKYMYITPFYFFQYLIKIKINSVDLNRENGEFMCMQPVDLSIIENNEGDRKKIVHKKLKKISIEVYSFNSE